MTDKKVSCFWQCGFSLMPIPLGLYAFYRIKKLKYGCLLYLIAGIISNGIYFIHISLANEGNEYSIIVYIIYVLSFILNAVFILYYIEKWSEEWNKKILVM